MTLDNRKLRLLFTRRPVQNEIRSSLGWEKIISGKLKTCRKHEEHKGGQTYGKKNKWILTTQKNTKVKTVNWTILSHPCFFIGNSKNSNTIYNGTLRWKNTVQPNATKLRILG
jgi:hypothetical protein